MKRGPDLSWLKEWRVAGIIGLLAGFLIGLLVFGQPWHLQPDWGDLPTWLLFGIGLVGGVIGLLQFRTFVREQGAEARRNEKRDKLMDRQLDDAERRAEADLRKQAEDVEVTWAQNTGQLDGVVVNNSRRPISRVTCKVMSNVDRAVLKMPDQCGERFEVGGRGGAMYFAPELKPLPEFKTLRPKATCIFTFKLTRSPDQVFVAWFTDDAGNRWQLDEYLHLVKANDGDESEYKP